MTDLTNYIEKLLNQGYSEDYIRKYLKNYGYDQQTISNALQRASRRGRTIKHEHHISKSAITFTLILLILATGIVVGVLEFAGLIGSEALLDFEIAPRDTTIQPGEELPYTVKLTNLGDKQRFDAILTYEIINEDGETLNSKEETFAVSTSVIRDQSITAPNQPGKYQLEAVAEYNDKKASSSFNFEVKGETEEEKQEPSTDPANVLEQVRQTANTQPSQAENLCMQIQNQTQKDDCLFLVVKKSDRSKFCRNIQETSTRDNCYMNFIVEGKTQLCNKVQLESNKNYCQRLRDVQMMSNQN